MSRSELTSGSLQTPPQSVIEGKSLEATSREEATPAPLEKGRNETRGGEKQRLHRRHRGSYSACGWPLD